MFIFQIVYNLNNFRSKKINMTSDFFISAGFRKTGYFEENYWSDFFQCSHLKGKGRSLIIIKLKRSNYPSGIHELSLIF